MLLVELEKQMPKTTEYMYDDVHYTRKGNELVAKEIGDALVAAKLIPRVAERRGLGGTTHTAGGPQP